MDGIRPIGWDESVEELLLHSRENTSEVALRAARVEGFEAARLDAKGTFIRHDYFKYRDFAEYEKTRIAKLVSKDKEESK